MVNYLKDHPDADFGDSSNIVKQPKKSRKPRTDHDQLALSRAIEKSLTEPAKCVVNFILIFYCGSSNLCIIKLVQVAGVVF